MNNINYNLLSISLIYFLIIRLNLSIFINTFLSPLILSKETNEDINFILDLNNMVILCQDRIRFIDVIRDKDVSRCESIRFPTFKTI